MLGAQLAVERGRLCVIHMSVFEVIILTAMVSAVPRLTVTIGLRPRTPAVERKRL